MSSIRQKILKYLYPFIVKNAKSGNKGTILKNNSNILPIQSIFNKKISLNNGKEIEVSSFEGKKIIIVNTASNCGFTAQYADLQALFEKHSDKVVVIGFPSNDFKQEVSDDKEISSFCQVNYGVNFPLAKQGVVVSDNEQQSVFKWITHKSENGWCEHQPDWNFSKYIVNESGVLTHYFGPAISPLEKDFLEAIGVS